MAVNITTDINTVTVTSTTANNVKIVDNGNNTSVTVLQPITRVIKVATVGPQGPVGPAIATGSLVTTASFNLYTGSSASQFAGTASYAQTASYAPSYLPLTGGTIAGSLVIQNNLTVLGSASIQHISESVLNIGTNIITVNTATPSIRFGGLSVIDSGSSPVVSASLLYDSIQDEFIFVHKGTSTSAVTSSHFVLGPETYNDLGNETYLSQNRIPKGVGNEHLNDSNITDSGTVVSINSNTQVTGSLTVTQGISGSFSGSGANLFNIPASGITGLNLSQIVSGSASASISPNNGLRVNANITTNANIIATTAPTTSLGSYNILTRNTSTGVFEKLEATTIQPLVYNILIESNSGITTQTLGVNNGAEYSQDGRNVMINNDTTAIIVTATNAPSGFIASYTKLSANNITFATSDTLVAPYGAVLNGNAGSTALLTKNGTTVYLLVNNLL